MNFSIKNILIVAGLLIGTSFGVYKMAFSSACCSTSSDSTSGCTPSSCRGAKTKFGEAKVIGELRLNLIDLKADMEKSADPKFDERSYDIHNIIGDTDKESIDIIVNEVKIVEDDFAQKLKHESTEFELPENKAKQIEYLNVRIEDLKALL